MPWDRDLDLDEKLKALWHFLNSRMERSAEGSQVTQVPFVADIIS